MARTGYDSARRMLYLVAFLRGGQRTREEIYDAIYDTTAPEKAFQRDRERLGELGYDVEERGEYFSLVEHLIDVELSQPDLTLLSIVASTFRGSKDDHKTIRSTVRKLLAGGQVREANLAIRIGASELSTLLDLASAMAKRVPVELSYASVSSDQPYRQRVEVMSIWSSLGQYYVTARRTHHEGVELEEPVMRTLKVARMSDVRPSAAATYEPVNVGRPTNLPALDRRDIVIIGDPNELPHVAERAEVDGQRMVLRSIGHVEALDLLSQIGTSGVSDDQEYLDRLTYLAELS